jgi:hypothetical protein
MWGVLVVMSAVVAVAIAPFVEAVVKTGVVRQGDGAPADDAVIVVSVSAMIRFALIIRYGAIVPHSHNYYLSSDRASDGRVHLTHTIFGF